jgi:hypothetical protein
MKLAPLLLACLLASCLSAPDRLGLTVGRGSGESEGPKCLDFENEETWVAATLEFPIVWRTKRPDPIVVYVPTAPAPAPVVAAVASTEEPPPTSPTPAPTKAAIVPAVTKGDEEKPPWWEDFTLVQTLILTALGAGAAIGAKPGYQKVRSLVSKRRAPPAAKKG